jgi:hypothetical protein
VSRTRVPDLKVAMLVNHACAGLSREHARNEARGAPCLSTALVTLLAIMEYHVHAVHATLQTAAPGPFVKVQAALRVHSSGCEPGRPRKFS